MNGRRGRWLKWVTSLAFLVLAAPVCGGLVLVHTDWGTARLQEMASRALHDRLGLDVEFREMRVETRIWPPEVRVEAQGMIAEDPVHGRLAEAERVEIHPSLWALLRGEIDLAHVELVRPLVRLVVRQGELQNLPDLGGSTAGPSKLPFDTLVARDARVELDAGTVGSIHLRELRLAARADEGSLTVHAETSTGHVEHARGRETLQRLRVDARSEPGERVAVDALELRTRHLSVRVREGRIGLPHARHMRGHVHVSVNLAHVAALPLAWDLPALGGRLELEGDTQWRPSGARAEGTVRLTNASIATWGLGAETTLEFSLRNDTLRISRGRAHLPDHGGVVQLHGRIGLAHDFPLQVNGTLDGVEFDRLMKELGISKDAVVSWHLEGGFELAGTLTPFTLDGPLRLQTRRFRVTRQAWHSSPRDRIVGVSRARVSSEVSVDPHALRFLDLVADTPGSRLRGDVVLGFDNRLQVDVRTDALDLADASPLTDIPIGGRGSARVHVSGTFSRPALEGHLDVRRFRFNRFRIGNVESGVRLEEDGIAVRFPRVHARKRDSRYEVRDLLLDWSRGRFEVTGTIHARRLPLRDVYHVFHYEDDERYEPYQGVARGLVDVHYTLGFPGDGARGTLVLDMDLDLPRMRIDGYAFEQGRFVGRWRWHDYARGYRDGELQIEHLELHKGEGVVTANGRMARGGRLRITTTADRIAFEDTEGLVDHAPDLEGSYGLVATVRGTLAVPRVHADLTVTGVTWHGKLLGDGRAYVRLTDVHDPWIRNARTWDPEAPPASSRCGHARAALAHADWPADPPLQTMDGPEPALERRMAYVVCGTALDERIRLDLALGRTEASPVRGLVELDGMSLGAFLPAQPQGEELTGTVSGRITIHDGGSEHPETLAGRARLSKLRIGTERVQIHNDGPVDVRLDHGRYRVARARFTGSRSKLRVSGTGALDGHLKTEVAGTLDLGLVSTLSPRVRHARGRLSVRTRLTGPLHDPAIHGRATVRNASFRFASFREPIRNLRGDVTFSARKVLFQEFRASVAGGRMAMNGYAAIEGRGLKEYRLDVRARGLTLTPASDVDVGLGADVQLAWKRGHRLPVARGTVRLERAVYARSIQLSPTLGELYRPSRAEVKDTTPEDDRLRLDLRVVAERPVRVNTSLVDARIRIEDTERPFKIVGTDQRIGALGTLVVSRGTIRFRGTKFDVRRGVIEFDDRFRIDPRFDLRAVTRIRRRNQLADSSWRVTLHAHGNRDAFRIDASSQPKLSQEDLMLLLAVGMTRAEAEQLRAGNVTGTAALEALTAVTGADREVQERLPVVDDFSITSRYSPQTNRTEPHISIGKRIADRVRLSASTALSESRRVQTGVQWRVGDRTSVQAVYDNINAEGTSSFGNVGVDFRWRLEFE